MLIRTVAPSGTSRGPSTDFFHHLVHVGAHALVRAGQVVEDFLLFLLAHVRPSLVQQHLIKALLELLVGFHLGGVGFDVARGGLDHLIDWLRYTVVWLSLFASLLSLVFKGSLFSSYYYYSSY